jgi:hypothetical protein
VIDGRVGMFGEHAKSSLFDSGYLPGRVVSIRYQALW